MAAPSRSPLAPPPADPWGPQGQPFGKLYLRAVRAHLPIVVLIVLAALVGTVAWVSGRPSVYEASAQLLVTPIPLEDTSYLSLPLVREAGDPTRTMQTAASLVETRAAAGLTAQRLRNSWPVERVEDSVDVEPRGQTSILDVRAEAPGADLAATVANTYARSVMDARQRALESLARTALAEVNQQLDTLRGGDEQLREDLERRRAQLQVLASGRDPTLSIAQAAVPPRSPSGAPVWLVIGLGLLSGIVLATGTAVLLQVLPDRVRDEQEVVQTLALPVIARVRTPRRRGRGRAGLLDGAPDVREELDALQARLELGVKGGRSGERAVLLASTSRGDRAPAVAVALGQNLARAGLAVLLVDADTWAPQLRGHLGLPEIPPLHDPLEPDRGLTDRQLLHVPDVPGLRLLELRALYARGSASVRVGDRLAPIQAAIELVDYVVIWTPPADGAGEALHALINEIDEVVLVADLDVARRSDLGQARDSLSRLGVSPTGLVVVGANARPSPRRAR